MHLQMVDIFTFKCYSSLLGCFFKKEVRTNLTQPAMLGQKMGGFKNMQGHAMSCNLSNSGVHLLHHFSSWWFQPPLSQNGFIFPK